MKTILLTQGHVALVDDADFEKVSAFSWHIRKKRRLIYAARKIRRPDGSRVYLYLHQFLMPGIKAVDHRDGDGLNCQRHNLRPATNRQNAQGFCHKRPGATSKYRGVCWHSRLAKWQARIRVNGKLIHLSYFFDQNSAAVAYDKAARQHFGEFATPNFKT